MLCSIEFRNDRSPKSEMLHETVIFKESHSQRISYVWLAQLDKHQTSKPVMISCEFNSHWRLYFCWNLSKPLDDIFVQKCQIYVICENFNLRIRQNVPNCTSVTEEHESCFYWARILYGWQEAIAIRARVDLHPDTDCSALWSACVRYRDTGLRQDTQINPLVQSWVCYQCFVDLWEMKSNWSK